MCVPVCVCNHGKSYTYVWVYVWVCVYGLCVWMCALTVPTTVFLIPHSSPLYCCTTVLLHSSFLATVLYCCATVLLQTISAGCPRLSSLTVSNLYLLADPSLSAPKKGAKIEAWQSVVGVAALDMHCKLVKHLNLSGCFRLVQALQVCDFISNLCENV